MFPCGTPLAHKPVGFFGYILHQEAFARATEMAQQLRVISLLALWFQGTDTLLACGGSRHTCGALTHLQAKTHKIK